MSVFVVVVTPVAVLVKVTDAFGITAPLVSRTSPKTLPAAPWPNAGGDSRTQKAQKAPRATRTPLSLPCEKRREFSRFRCEFISTPFSPRILRMVFTQCFPRFQVKFSFLTAVPYL